MADLDSIAAAEVERAMSPQAELLELPVSAQVAIANRRVGRPVGAKSRRFEDTARAVIERFGDPLLRQVAIATMPLEELVAAGVPIAVALAEQRLSAATVLPYLHQRQAIAVDVTHQRTVALTIITGLAGEGSGVAPEILGVVENQGLSDDEADAVAQSGVAQDG